MAVTDPEKALEHPEIKRFGGIRSGERIALDGAAEIRNFRILPDGSLQKRCGYRKWLSLSAPLRGTWEGVINGESYFFAVAGNTGYCLLSENEEPIPVAFLNTSEGEVSFVYYRDQLYLMDGAELYRFLPSTRIFSVADGYTPLYGRNWHPHDLGAVHEPLNAIQNRIRIHYLNTTGTTTFRLPFTMKTINRVKVGSSYITNYLFNKSSMSVEIPTGTVGGTVEISATLDDIFNRRNIVLRSNRAIAYRDAYHETFLCYGNSPGYTVYRSRHVSADMLAASNAVFGNSDALYIPTENSFTVGSTQHPVTALLQHGEQVLVMNDRNLWAIRPLDDESDDMRIYLLRTDVGCSAKNAVTATGGDPITVNENGIFRLRFSTKDLDDVTPERLSNRVTELLDRSLLQNAILHVQKNSDELWLKNSTDATAPTLVYSPSLDNWVIFDGIAATRFFSYAGRMGFSAANGNVYLMDEELDTDDGTAFDAVYVSHYLPFAYPALQKRSLRAFLGADSRGGEILLTLKSEHASHSHCFYGTDQDAPEFLDLRATLGRFRFLRYSITATGSARTRIHFLTFAANN